MEMVRHRISTSCKISASWIFGENAGKTIPLAIPRKRILK